jgi:hypothetical protein
MIRTVFVVVVVLVIYFSFVSPLLNNMRAVSKDEELHAYMLTIKEYERYDPRSYSKCISHLKNFMMYYSDTYHEGSTAMQKMKNHKIKVVYYVQRMIHRLPNDANMDYVMKNTLEKLNNKLDNYINEAADRKGEYYFPKEY